MDGWLLFRLSQVRVRIRFEGCFGGMVDTCVRVGGGGEVCVGGGGGYLRWVGSIANKQRKVRREWFPCLLLEIQYGTVRVGLGREDGREGGSLKGRERGRGKAERGGGKEGGGGGIPAKGITLR